MYHSSGSFRDSSGSGLFGFLGGADFVGGLAVLIGVISMVGSPVGLGGSFGLDMALSFKGLTPVGEGKRPQAWQLSLSNESPILCPFVSSQKWLDTLTAPRRC